MCLHEALPLRSARGAMRCGGAARRMEWTAGIPIWFNNTQPWRFACAYPGVSKSWRAAGTLRSTKCVPLLFIGERVCMHASTAAAQHAHTHTYFLKSSQLAFEGRRGCREAVASCGPAQRGRLCSWGWGGRIHAHKLHLEQQRLVPPRHQAPLAAKGFGLGPHLNTGAHRRAGQGRARMSASASACRHGQAVMRARKLLQARQAPERERTASAPSTCLFPLPGAGGRWHPVPVCTRACGARWPLLTPHRSS